MGYSTQEFTSASLTNLYPSLFKEFQAINWSHVDVTITDMFGDQEDLPCSNEPCREPDACVVLETIKCNGMRIRKDSTIAANDQRTMQIPGKRAVVNFDDFRNHPIRIEEFHCIISTKEQKMIAKNMACAINYGSVLYENRTDVELTDPRFVFQVIDPNNEFTALFLNLFGQTIILRAGQFGQRIPSTVQTPIVPEASRLICYLRYPTAYFANASEKQVVFDIPLNGIYKKEPYRLPNGDLICVATDMESLSEVLAKKSSLFQAGIDVVQPSDKMIPRDVYDAAEANFKTECERIKSEAEQKYSALMLQKASETATLKNKIVNLTTELEAEKTKVRQWETIHEVHSKANEDLQKVELVNEKVRKEAYENVKDEIETWKTVNKIVGTVLTGVLSFAITMFVQVSKKK